MSASRGASVTVVERFEPALARLGDAARAQGLELELVASDAADFLDDLLSASGARAARHFDAVVVNPPRRGLTPRVREAVARLGPRRVDAARKTLLDALETFGGAAAVRGRRVRPPA